MTPRAFRASTARRTGVLVVAALGVLGCPRRSDAPATGASASASASVPAPVASGVPFDPKELSDQVNPDGKREYSGPVGTVEGRIVASGDPAVEQPEIAQQIPEKCAAARPFYAKVFREGEGRALADVLVSVIGYHEYIPAKEPTQRFVAKDCAFETRTIALTLGQRLEVVSGDKEAYVPELVGQRGHAQIVATPGGQVAAMLYPTEPGRFVLIDNLRLFMTSEVLVVKYATIDVTGIDGRYRVAGLPPGKLMLSAFLPATGGTVQKEITIEGGKTTTVDIQIPFDANAYRQALAAQRDAGIGVYDAGTGRDAGVAKDAGAAKDAGPAASASAKAKVGKPAPSAKP